MGQVKFGYCSEAELGIREAGNLFRFKSTSTLTLSMKGLSKATANTTVVRLKTLIVTLLSCVFGPEPWRDCEALEAG